MSTNIMLKDVMRELAALEEPKMREAWSHLLSRWHSSRMKGTTALSSRTA